MKINSIKKIDKIKEDNNCNFNPSYEIVFENNIGEILKGYIDEIHLKRYESFDEQVSQQMYLKPSEVIEFGLNEFFKNESEYINRYGYFDENPRNDNFDSFAEMYKGVKGYTTVNVPVKPLEFLQKLDRETLISLRESAIKNYLVIDSKMQETKNWIESDKLIKKWDTAYSHLSDIGKALPINKEYFESLSENSIELEKMLFNNEINKDKTNYFKIDEIINSSVYKEISEADVELSEIAKSILVDDEQNIQLSFLNNSNDISEFRNKEDELEL